MRRTQGQTLIMLLVTIAVVVTIATAATTISIINTTAHSRIQRGVVAYYMAEGGIENALLRLLRDPEYEGEVLQIGGGTVTTVVTQDPPTILSTAQLGSIVKKVEAVVQLGSELEIISWREVE